MITDKAYYMGTHPNSFRSGEPAWIAGVITAYPNGAEGKAVVCFRVIYADGREDFSPVGDVNNYVLLTQEEVTTKYATK